MEAFVFSLLTHDMRDSVVGRRRLLMLALATASTTCALAGAVAAAEATPAPPGPGNSANAKECQKGAWQNLVTSTGDRFANEGACASYAAKGGTIGSPYPGAQALCESYGGTFYLGPHLVDPSSGRGEVLWECNYWSSASMQEFEQRHRSLNDECVFSGGLGVPAGRWLNERGEEVWNSPCVRLPS